MVLVGVGLLEINPSLHPAVAGTSAVIAAGAVAVLALRFLNPRLKTIAEWDAEGLVTTDTFVARRAFQVEELEDEGSHYFLELEDGSVLFLSGQYLYDYEEDFAGSRRFPCSQFEVRRHREEGYALEIVCRGDVMEPEALAPPFREDDYRNDVPEDGSVIRDKTYEQLRAERLSNA